MFRIKVLNALKECGVVAVVRGTTKEIGVKISESCIRGNVKAIEVTYTNKFANEIIKELSEKYHGNDEVVIGAGTVLDSETARMAILAGAQYIVSPSFNKDTAILCNRYNVPYIPGVMTINEIVTAYESGVDVVKLFRECFWTRIYKFSKSTITTCKYYGNRWSEFRKYRYLGKSRSGFSWNRGRTK